MSRITATPIAAIRRENTGALNALGLAVFNVTIALSYCP